MRTAADDLNWNSYLPKGSLVGVFRSRRFLPPRYCKDSKAFIEYSNDRDNI